MPSRLLLEADVCIGRGYFMGLTRDETARRCSKSGGTVSGVWHELEALIGPDGQAASDAVIPLLKLNLSPGEAARGARIFSLMRRLGVKEEGIGRFVEEFLKCLDRIGMVAALEQSVGGLKGAILRGRIGWIGGNGCRR